MRRIHTETETTGVGVNLTPMIDILFILLIFFVVTSSFVKEAGIEVNRPSAQTAVRKERGNIIIAITKGGEIWLDKRRIDRRAVRSYIERLHAENPKGGLVVQADRGAKYEKLEAVLAAARAAGLTEVAIATET